MTSWKQTEYPGVRFREHPTRKHRGKPDRYYAIRYRIDGERKEVSLGWASQKGWTAAKANDELLARKPKKKAPPPDEVIPAEAVLTLPKQFQSQPEENSSVTFKAAAALYVEWAKANKRTWKDDQTRMAHHVLPLFGKCVLSQIGFREIELLKLNGQTKGLAPASVVQCLAVTRAVFNFAGKMGFFCGTNPVKLVKFPKVNNKRTRFLSHQEAKTLLDTAASYNPELHDMCLICLYTGIRSGEMAALRWFDLDFSHGLITIRDAKNGETRQVFMTQNVKEMLQQRVCESQAALVFPSKTGKERDRISKLFRDCVDKLGLNKDVTNRQQRVVFHTLRHTFASWLALQGETLLTIKELMGHKSIEMTMRYAHLIPDQKRSAVEKLAAMASEV